MMTPIRVLHVVGQMNRGGYETWLLQLARVMVGRDITFDFLVHNTEPGAYDDELRALGCRIIPCRLDRFGAGFARRLAHVFRERGPFDVVHSHAHHFSGIVLAVARLCGVPIRIAHSHAASESAQVRLSRRAYLAVTELLIRGNATAGIAVSEGAADSLFGKGWRRDPRWHIQYCSIDVERYRTHVSRAAVRKALSISPTSFVVGHVGRFARQKNHRFLVDVFSEVKAVRSDAQLVLIGDGPLNGDIRNYVSARRLADSVHFLGLRSDVAELMACAMDVFVMPSLFEGLPIVALEAQAAGLPMVLADTITAELEVIPELVRWHSLSESPAAWASTAVAIGQARVPQDQSLPKMLRSPFSLDTGAARLRATYGL